MAWNEPGGGDKDPWGNNGGRKNDGPPDLDDLFKDLGNKVSSIFGGGGRRGGKSGSGNNGMWGVLIIVVVLLVVCGYIYQGLGVVNEQERAVVLRFGSYHETKGPGLRWNPPLIDSVYTVNVTRVRLWSTTQQMLTKDLNIVDIKLSAQYSIDDAQHFVLKVKDPQKSLEQAANSALRHVVGSNAMHDVLTEGRAQIAVDVQTRLQTYLDSYTTGIHVEKVNIEDSNPPREVQSAFDDVIRAREDEERFKNEAQAYANDKIPSARGKAQSMIEEAKAYKSQVVAEAEGEAKRFELLLTQYELAPKVTRERLYIDAMQAVMNNSTKVLVDVDGGNNMLYLPLDKLMDASREAAATKRTSMGLNQDDLDKIKLELMDQLRGEQSSGSLRGGR